MEDLLRILTVCEVSLILVYLYRKFKLKEKKTNDTIDDFNDIITTINNNINNIIDEKIRKEFIKKVTDLVSKYDKSGDYSNLDELRDLSQLLGIYLLGQYTSNENIMRNVGNELMKEQDEKIEKYFK